MEVAGVILGTVPLILYALDNYQRAWSPARDIWHWNETIETIKTQIFLQKQQLQTTLRTLVPELTDRTTIAEIHSVLQISHPSQCDQFLDIIRQMDALVNEMAKDLFPDAQGPPNWTDARSERMNWEWRRVKRSFGRKERKGIFNQLQMWNTALQNCGLNKSEILPDSENRIINLIRGRFDEKQTTTIRENIQALHRAISSGLGCKCPNPHAGNIELDWHEDKSFTASAFSLAISSREMVHAPGAANDVSWRHLSVTVEQSAQAATTAQPSPLPTTPPLETSKVVSSRPVQPRRKGVRLLALPHGKEEYARTKSPSRVLFSAPPCPTENGIMPVSSGPLSPTSFPKLCSILQGPHSHQFPTCIPIPNSDPCQQVRITSTDRASAGSAAPKRIVQLPALLSRVVDRITSRRLVLNRKQRFGIAAALSWAVLHLCDSPWLEGALDDRHIHLFIEQENGSAGPKLSSHPYLSCHFDPRPAVSGSTRNSTTLSTQFQVKQVQNMTLYTLAICLIELGLNKPFDQIRKDHHAATNSSPPIPAQQGMSTLADDFEVAKHQITELILDAGTFYGHAVDRCLRFLFPGPAAMNTFEHCSFRTTFFADVVAPIQTTFELIPGSCSHVVLQRT